MPVPRLHGVQECDPVSPDHAELCHQEMPEKAEANGACQVLHGMIRDSAYPPHAAHGIRGGGRNPPRGGGRRGDHGPRLPGRSKITGA